MKIDNFTVRWIDGGSVVSNNFSFNEGMGRDGICSDIKSIELTHGQLINFKISGNKISLVDVRVSISVGLNDRKVMANGYQTWTESRESDGESKAEKINPVLYNLLKPYGDYSFVPCQPEKGHVFSWTYTYVRGAENVLLLGSCNEMYGFTGFDADYAQNTVTVIKDCKGMELTGEVDILKIYIGQGSMGEVWDEYVSNIPNFRKPYTRCLGWTSWYNYYTNINEEIITQNLKSIYSAQISIEVFQIDDGYQRAVGDWLDVNDKFPSGMKKIAGDISNCGYKPGLWLAPFICEKRSNIFKDHKEWILKDNRGNMVKAGWNPNWSGTFYSLDFYNEGFREYLKRVFDTVLNVWGYRMLKLDFLYAACVINSNGKSRGQIMTEAMDFIREQVGDNYILGCGVPLGPAFGRVDYCRIGSDAATYWEDKKLSFLNYKERVSTFNSLISTIGRHQLNSRVFGSDPDVFIIRSNNNKLNDYEKFTLFVINNLLGGLVFFSDNIDGYSSREMGLLKEMYPAVNPIINRIEGNNNLYIIELSNMGMEYTVYCNLSDKPSGCTVEYKSFNADRFIMEKGTQITLNPHETMVLYRIDDCKYPYMAGAKGHILPCSQVENIKFTDDEIKISLSRDCSDQTEVIFCVHDDCPGFKVNDKWHTAERIGGCNCIRVSKS